MSLQNRRTFYKNNLIRRQATKPPELEVCKINLFNSPNIIQLLLYVVSLKTADEAYNYLDSSINITFEEIRWNLAIKDYGNFVPLNSGPLNSKLNQSEKLFTHMKQKSLFDESSVKKILLFFDSSVDDLYKYIRLTMKRELEDFKLQVNFKLAIAARKTNSKHDKVWGLYNGEYFLAEVIGKCLFKSNNVIVQWCTDSLISEITHTEIKQLWCTHLIMSEINCIDRKEFLDRSLSKLAEIDRKEFLEESSIKN